jgi:hypothetical protein
MGKVCLKIMIRSWVNGGRGLRKSLIFMIFSDIFISF